MTCNTANKQGQTFNINTANGPVGGDVGTYINIPGSQQSKIDLVSVLDEAEQKAANGTAKREIRSIKETLKRISSGTLDFISKIIGGVITNGINRSLHP